MSSHITSKTVLTGVTVAHGPEAKSCEHDTPPQGVARLIMQRDMDYYIAALVILHHCLLCEVKVLRIPEGEACGEPSIFIDFSIRRIGIDVIIR
ncbi:hypothetical protein IWQ62_003921 [Dispira parvispora]|uniref:Uncharacterized protein n=1 Tax=Dispira parvispora TaxID=1520584 RepID=A0A9W8AML8_9FUNG|nr:hypothetical protein IWQ62_003921 [Dispira parvispora]